MGTNPQGKRAERTRGIHPQALSHVVIQVTKIPTNGWPNFVRCQNRSQKSSKPHRDKVLRWHLSRPEFLFNSVVLPNWIKSIVWCACSYCIKKEKEAGKSYTKPTLFVCSAAIAKVTIVSASLRGVWRCRAKKIDAQKALHSNSVSTFTASIIKSGFYGHSNPNFSISWMYPAPSHQD